MNQIDVTITVNVDNLKPSELSALHRLTGQAVASLTGGTVIDSRAQRVADEIAAYDWDNSLTREFAWLIADREEEDAEEVIEWIHKNENDPFIWDRVSDMADRITESARMGA